MKTKQLLLVGLSLSLAAARAMAGTPGIEGSAHDFSQSSWNLVGATGGSKNYNTNSVCMTCHTPHNSDITVTPQLVPLWAHATTVSSFTPYTSPFMLATDAGSQPSGVSKACLSCHDGTVAINQAYNSTNTTGGAAAYVSTSHTLGTNLSANHPISITYNTALSVADSGFLYDPSVQTITYATGIGLTGKTIAQGMLVNNKVECSSCHDVHNQIGNAPSSGVLLKIGGVDANNRGDTLCRTCHNK